MRLASGADHLVIQGSLRDSAHGAVTGTPGSFWTTTPPTLTSVGALLFGHLQAHPGGSEA